MLGLDRVQFKQTYKLGSGWIHVAFAVVCGDSGIIRFRRLA